MTNEELKALALAATPGPWSYDGSYVCPSRVEGGTTYVETWRSVADCNQPENTRFIAAANPAAVLGLIADNESLAKNYKSLCDSVAHLNVAAISADDEVWRLKAECEGLRKALSDVFNHVEGNTECLVRDLVNWGTPQINPNDFYGECEAIKSIVQDALGRGGQGNG